MDTRELSDKVRPWLAAVPNLGRLFMRLARDPRVPRRSKILFGVVAAYLLIPFDIIPDWIPGLGQFDDIFLIVLALDVMLNRVPDEVIKEHWRGDPEVLEKIRAGLSTATSFVPARIRRIFSDSAS